jgi:CRP-like cAMP-binding protein
MPLRTQARIRLVASEPDAELVDYLRGHRLFGALPPEALLAVAGHTRLRTYPRGAHLYVEGDPTTHVYIVRSGLVAMSEVDDRGLPRVVITYAADDVSGSMCSTLGMTHPCRTTALVESRVLLLPKRIFDEMYEKHPKLGRRVLEEVNHIMRRSRRTILRLMLTPVTARVASFLLSVPEPAGEITGETTGENSGRRVEPALSHQDLALLLGTTRESVTRVLDRLAAEGAITVARRCIEILDRERLKQLVVE